MKSCEYSETPKGYNKQTRILRKRYISFHRKQYKLLHSSVCIYLVDKVSPTFFTQNNGVKNVTMTQWGDFKHLFLVQIWVYIITIL